MRYIETIKILDGIPFNLSYHQKRMKITSGITLPQIIIPYEFRTGLVKCRIIYGMEVIETTFFHYTLPSINSLKIVKSTDIEYSKKSEERSQINTLYNQRDDCDDILIIKNGAVTDSSFCNVIFKNKEGLFTPSSPLLSGTKREKLLDEKIITSRLITIDDIKSYDSIYLVNAMIELEDNICVDIISVR